MEELAILKLFLTKSIFLKYNKYIKNLTLEEEIKIILNLLETYYEEFPEKESVSIDELEVYFELNYASYKNIKLIKTLLARLDSLKVSVSLVNKVLTKLLEKYFASEIVDSLANVLDGSESNKMSTVEPLLEEFNNLTAIISEVKSPFVEKDLRNILEKRDEANGLHWRLSCLNTDVGPLFGKTLSHVFARVDTGKTSFLASEVTNFAKQLKDGECIIWFNNEEDGEKVQTRVYSAMLGVPYDVLAKKKEEAYKKFLEVGGDKIHIYDEAIIDIKDIEAVLKEYKPRLIVIDQGDKITFHGDGKYSTVEKLKVLYGKFRQLAKKYECDIITAGQADASAEGIKWLNLTNMDFSKTGKPGELDFAIGIGAKLSVDDTEDSTRYIHICKNKMKTGLHGKYRAHFDHKTARYTG